MKTQRLSLKLFLSLAAGVSALVIQSGCSTPNTAYDRSRSQDGTLTSESIKEPQKENLETVAILGTNDLHGALLPFSLHSRETNRTSHSIAYQAAGLATLANYIEILRSEFGDHMLWLDAGDQFQGSIESNMELGKPMVEFFNKMGLNAAAIGNHEFDFGMSTLNSRMQEAQYTYLAANILDKNSGDRASFPNTQPYRIFNLGKLKVGVIGLSTLDTPKTTKSGNVRTLEFEELEKATLREAQDLRDEGANIVILLSHVGLKCDNPPNTNRRMWKAKDIEANASPHAIGQSVGLSYGGCDPQDEMVKLLRTLPAGTVDVAIAGHSHQIVHHWVAGVPVIQGGAFGKYFNVVYLTYDWGQKRLKIEDTYIEGPIPVCTKVFENQNDCNGDIPPPPNGRGPLIPARFHGKTIQPNPTIKALVASVVTRTKAVKSKTLGSAEQPLDLYRSKESPLGNLVADALRWTAKTDFAYANSGGIRAPIEQGQITYEDIFRTFPFDNVVATIQLKWSELKSFLQVAQSGSRGLGSISGLRIKMIDPKFPAPIFDLSGDGRFELWKTNRLIEITLPDGRPLDPEKTYTLATLDFVAMGGDDLQWPISQISPERIKIWEDKLARTAIVNYVEHLKIVNSEESPLLDVAHPRLQFVSPKEEFKQSGKKKLKKIRNTFMRQK